MLYESPPAWHYPTAILDCTKVLMMQYCKLLARFIFLSL
jgi:hypothetical protein